MKFKEIKSGMVIHCPTEESAMMLKAHMDNLGYERVGNSLPAIGYYSVHEGVNGAWYCLEAGVMEHEITELSDLIEPGPRFKVGDRVRIKENLMKNGVYGKLTMHEDMMKWKGSEVNVNKVTENGRYELKSLPYYWSEEMLEPVDDSPINSDIHSPTDSPMMAEEVLEWLSKHCGGYDMIEAFGRDKYDGAYELSELIRDFTPQEIIDKITAYEAAKKVPKPVEVEYGKLLYLSVKNADNGLYETYSSLEYWPDERAESYEAVKKQFLSGVARETQKTARTSECDICRIKEDK
ncbi:MAG: hypothetical protein LUG62_01190 [Clostridiales bacterium]|nr:hypothetical protein [Clostridiales bacterium]